MAPWEWLIGYVVLFALLHVLLYYAYVRRNGSTGTTASASYHEGDGAPLHSAPRVDGYSQQGVEEPPPPPDIDGDPLTCRHCGAANERDPTFTYCRICVSPLEQYSSPPG